MHSFSTTYYHRGAAKARKMPEGISCIFVDE
jgi:hypothetical protein